MYFLLRTVIGFSYIQIRTQKYEFDSTSIAHTSTRNSRYINRKRSQFFIRPVPKEQDCTLVKKIEAQGWPHQVSFTLRIFSMDMFLDFEEPSITA